MHRPGMVAVAMVGPGGRRRRCGEWAAGRHAGQPRSRRRVMRCHGGAAACSASAAAVRAGCRSDRGERHDCPCRCASCDGSAAAAQHFPQHGPLLAGVQHRRRLGTWRRSQHVQRRERQLHFHSIFHSASHPEVVRATVVWCRPDAVRRRTWRTRCGRFSAIRMSSAGHASASVARNAVLAVRVDPLVKKIGFLSFGTGRRHRVQIRGRHRTRCCSRSTWLWPPKNWARTVRTSACTTSRGSWGLPFPLLAAVGTRTSRIEIGTAVIDMRYENPLYMVEDAGAADLIAGGRLQLGISRGSPEQVIDGWRYFGYQPHEGQTDADMARGHAQVLLEVLRGEGFAQPDPARCFRTRPACCVPSRTHQGCGSASGGVPPPSGLPRGQPSGA